MSHEFKTIRTFPSEYKYSYAVDPYLSRHSLDMKYQNIVFDMIYKLSSNLTCICIKDNDKYILEFLKDGVLINSYTFDLNTYLFVYSHSEKESVCVVASNKMNNIKQIFYDGRLVYSYDTNDYIRIYQYETVNFFAVEYKSLRERIIVFFDSKFNKLETFVNADDIRVYADYLIVYTDKTINNTTTKQLSLYDIKNHKQTEFEGKFVGWLTNNTMIINEDNKIGNDEPSGKTHFKQIIYHKSKVE